MIKWTAFQVNENHEKKRRKKNTSIRGQDTLWHLSQSGVAAAAVLACMSSLMFTSAFGLPRSFADGGQ